MSPRTHRLEELRLGDLATFLAVRRAGSISGAARELDVTPSQVSKAIARIEAALNVQLLSRGGRIAALGEAGLRILPHVEAAVTRLLLISRESERSVAQLKVAAPSYLLAAFMSVIESAVAPLQARGLELPPALLRAYAAEDYFDVCLFAGGPAQLPPTWVGVSLGRLRRGLFAAPELARRLGQEPVSVDAVRAWPFVTPVYCADGQLLPGDDDCPLRSTERIAGHRVLAIGQALQLASRSQQLVFGPVIAARRYVEEGSLREVTVAGWNVASDLILACNVDRVLSRVQSAVAVAVKSALGAGSLAIPSRLRADSPPALRQRAREATHKAPAD
jgi:DNA-binding transcriptional LysR family regulator